jgi:hypothetical protein
MSLGKKVKLSNGLEIPYVHLENNSGATILIYETVNWDSEPGNPHPAKSPEPYSKRSKWDTDTWISHSCNPNTNLPHIQPSLTNHPSYQNQPEVAEGIKRGYEELGLKREDFFIVSAIHHL